MRLSLTHYVLCIHFTKKGVYFVLYRCVFAVVIGLFFITLRCSVLVIRDVYSICLFLVVM